MNAKLKAILIGFSMRLYHNLQSDDPLLSLFCQYACDEDIFDLCYIENEKEKLFPMLWRFLPVIDPQVQATQNTVCSKKKGEK